MPGFVCVRRALCVSALSHAHTNRFEVASFVDSKNNRRLHCFSLPAAFRFEPRAQIGAVLAADVVVRSDRAGSKFSDFL